MNKQPIIVSRSLIESLNETLTDNFSVYAAKNVSNDFNFTKLLVTSKPTSSPTLIPTQLPTTSPTLSPTITTSSPPTNLPTFVSSSVPSIRLSNKNSIRSCPEPTSITSDNRPSQEEPVVSMTKYITFFNYEVVTPNQGIDIEEAIQNLEEKILEETSKSVLSCNDGTSTFPSRRRRLLEGDAKIVRMESDPPDVMNEINVECSADTGITAAGDVKCIPMIGAMTFYSDCDTCPYPENEILASIEKAMTSGAFVDNGDDNGFVKQVNFVGTKESPPPILPPVELETSTRPRSNVVGIIVGVMLIQVFATVLFVMKRRKLRRRALYVDETWMEDDYAFEPETVPIELSEILEVFEEEEGINVSFLKNVSLSLTRKFSFQK